MAINPGCNLIAVVGGKGGVGKSVLAANFACAMMLELRTQVLLIDADGKSCGDQNIILGVRPTKTLAEVAAFTGSLNPQALPQLVTQHPSGLGFIAAVRGPEETLRVNSDLLMKQIEFLSRSYKYIVVDLGNDLQALQHKLLAEATAIVLVTVPEVLVINQTQRLIQDLLTATYPMEMFQLVINKMSNAGLAPQAIAQSLRIAPIGVIPLDDITTAGALQRSNPFVLSAANAPISAAYHDIVRRLTGGVLQRLKTLQKPLAANPSVATATDLAGNDGMDPRTALKIRVHNELIKAMDLKKGITDTQGDRGKEEALRLKTQSMITQIVDKESPEWLATTARA